MKRLAFSVNRRLCSRVLTVSVLTLYGLLWGGSALGADKCPALDLTIEEGLGPQTEAELQAEFETTIDEGLNKVSRCLPELAESGSSAGAQGSQGQSDSDERITAAPPSPSPQASGVIRGTEPPSPTEADTPASEAPQSTRMDAGSPVASRPTQGRREPLLPGPGAGQQEIKSANNQNVLARQIREAAERETDPERKAALMEEYQKMQGSK